MGRRNYRSSHHESPHEQRLREIVNGFVPGDIQKSAYLAFAREVARSVRKPVPDFEQGTKRVVMKWFERGLHGRWLWRIGQAAIHERVC